MRLDRLRVRPHLEYCIQAWNPFLRKYKVILGRVQRRAIKVIKGCQELSYEEMLRHCGFTTQEKGE